MKKNILSNNFSNGGIFLSDIVLIQNDENLTNLEYLQLWENELSGIIPPEIYNLTNLIELKLDGNSLNGESLPLDDPSLFLYKWRRRVSGSLQA